MFEDKYGREWMVRMYLFGKRVPAKVYGLAGRYVPKCARKVLLSEVASK